MNTKMSYYSYFYQKLTNYLESNPGSVDREVIHSKVLMATDIYMKFRTDGKEPADAVDLGLDILYDDCAVNTDIIY